MEKDRILREGIDLNSSDVWYEGDAITLNDNLYTGIGYELFNNGSIKYVAFYKDGFAYGSSKELYDNGQIKEETELLHGQVNGTQKCWYPNGKVKSISKYEYGIEVEYREWDENGNLLTSRVIDQDDPNSWYPYLLKLREQNKGKYQDELKYVLSQI